LYGLRTFASFLKRVLALIAGDDPAHRRMVRRANAVSVDATLELIASQYAVSADEYVGFCSSATGRDMAAYLCRRDTSATLRELAQRFDWSHPDKASDLVRRGA
jgi:putative transposase